MVFFAHFTILISFSLYHCLSGLRKVFKNREVQISISTLHQLAHLTTVKVNWLLREVTAITVYELPVTNEVKAQGVGEQVAGEAMFTTACPSPLTGITGPVQLVIDHWLFELSFT